MIFFFFFSFQSGACFENLSDTPLQSCSGFLELRSSPRPGPGLKFPGLCTRAAASPAPAPSLHPPDCLCAGHPASLDFLRDPYLCTCRRGGRDSGTHVPALVRAPFLTAETVTDAPGGGRRGEGLAKETRDLPGAAGWKTPSSSCRAVDGHVTPCEVTRPSVNQDRKSVV